MLSLRRYAIFFGCAVIFLLELNHYYHNRLLPLSQSSHPLVDSSSKALKPADDRFHWETVSVHYPVRSLTPLPTGAPQRIPKVQFDFPHETVDQATTRQARQAAVKSTFERCWQAYKKHAWMHDELAPLTAGVKDGFGGLAATLVDNIDNLWIMGLKTEFEDAVAAMVDIDLGKITSEDVNVFETTIRHLGGLLSAYDLSGDQRLLDKAKEFGEMLLKAFDTPNHMPITRWKPKEALEEGPQVAPSVVLLAEIGSLSMEFTHLSQVTGDARWYDAVERITRAFAEQQYETHLPGMWPVTVNARDIDFTQDTMFTLSAMSDSFYEYFPKMHALLGGVEPIYKKMYEGSMKTAIKHNLWRPMTPDNADILVAGNVRAKERAQPKLDPQGQHLACFTGGMFALGGKLFNEPGHVEIGQKLTDGCIWAYRALPLGIMPEDFHMVPCESRLQCEWDEQKWMDEIKDSSSPSDVKQTIEALRLPKGFIEISDRRYILRPEAIESVFILYRITGQERLQEAAWEMFTSIINATESPLANAALSDVTFTKERLAKERPNEHPSGTTQMDSMESFWMAETLKYFYLIFSEPDVINLDEWVFNTEAHPFKRPLAK